MPSDILVKSTTSSIKNCKLSALALTHSKYSAPSGDTSSKARLTPVRMLEIGVLNSWEIVEIINLLYFSSVIALLRAWRIEISLTTMMYRQFLSNPTFWYLSSNLTFSPFSQRKYFPISPSSKSFNLLNKGECKSTLFARDGNVGRPLFLACSPLSSTIFSLNLKFDNFDII